MKGPLLLIAAGGTGGHMFPAQALAEAMVRRGWRVKLSTDARGARYTGGFPHVVAVEQVASATFARGGMLAKLAVPFRDRCAAVAGGLARDAARPARRRWWALVGYPTIPALAAAWLAGVPRVIHEQNGVLGRVNRLFARRVQGFACGTWPTDLPAGVTGEHVGNPVRAAVADRAGAPYIAPGDYPLSLVVLGGSQGARVLSEVVPAGLALLPEDMRARLRVAHQAREEDREAVRAAYGAAHISAEVQSFFTDVPRRLAEAQLVIARAGASTVAELSVVGRPAILVPYGAATGDRPDRQLRAACSHAGAAVLIPESRFDAAALAEQVALVLGNPQAAEQMARAALAYGIADATERLVAMVERVAGARP